MVWYCLADHIRHRSTVTAWEQCHRLVLAFWRRRGFVRRRCFWLDPLFGLRRYYLLTLRTPTRDNTNQSRTQQQNGRRLRYRCLIVNDKQEPVRRIDQNSTGSRESESKDRSRELTSGRNRYAPVREELQCSSRNTTVYACVPVEATGGKPVESHATGAVNWTQTAPGFSIRLLISSDN